MQPPVFLPKKQPSKQTTGISFISEIHYNSQALISRYTDFKALLKIYSNIAILLQVFKNPF